MKPVIEAGQGRDAAEWGQSFWAALTLFYIAAFWTVVFWLDLVPEVLATIVGLIGVAWIFRRPR